jgi:hypothetical protein
MLAFLSACQTAKGDEDMPDQAVHLAASMLFCGFKSVIATMLEDFIVDEHRCSERAYLVDFTRLACAELIVRNSADQWPMRMDRPWRALSTRNFSMRRLLTSITCRTHSMTPCDSYERKRWTLSVGQYLCIWGRRYGANSRRYT